MRLAVGLSAAFFVCALSACASNAGPDRRTAEQAAARAEEAARRAELAASSAQEAAQRADSAARRLEQEGTQP